MFSYTSNNSHRTQRSMSGSLSLIPVPNIHGLFDEYRQDPTATHFLLRLLPSLTPIGTIRVYRADEENYYKLSRLAVLKTYRKYGFGRDLVFVVHQWVQDDAKRIGSLQPIHVVCHSQLPVKAFYSRYVRSVLRSPSYPLNSLSRYGYQPEVISPALYHDYR